MIDVSALLAYARANPKVISIATQGTLVKLNYTQKCQFDKTWNQYTLVSRGIIIDTATNLVIAHPFDKFFNEFEYPAMNMAIPFDHPFWVTEKLDGVLIVPYRADRALRFSSRGSFANEYIEKAYQIAPFKDLPVEQYTFIFELISPEYSQGGFLVTKYDHEALVLVGARNNQTDQLLTPPEVITLAHSLHLPVYHLFDWSYDYVRHQQTGKLNSTEEGWVVFFVGGFLVKMKRLEYIHLFRANKNCTSKKVVEMLQTNQFETFLQMLPEELVATATAMRDEVEQKFRQKSEEIIATFDMIPAEIKADQRDFSFYIIRHFHKDLLKYLYKYKSTLNTEDLRQIFYRDCLNAK